VPLISQELVPSLQHHFEKQDIFHVVAVKVISGKYFLARE
jgi:hypothetical protein